MTQEFLTIGQLAKRFDQPEWKIRRIVDAVSGEVPRFGLYRAVPVALLPKIIERLARKTAGAAR